MKLALPIVFTAALLAGCEPTTRIIHNQPVTYQIECGSGSTSRCHQEAYRYCPRGYNVLGGQNAAVTGIVKTAPRYGGYMAITSNNEIIVQCR